VIFEDPALEGASEAVVRSRYRAWLETRGLYKSPHEPYQVMVA
jgi:hypothetical protein